MLAITFNAVVVWREKNIPTTITLKLKPFLTLLRCHWLGKFAKPTYPVNFLRTMFFMSVAASAAAFGSLEETLCGTTPASDAMGLLLLTLGIGELPFDMVSGTGDGRLGGAPLVAGREH